MFADDTTLFITKIKVFILVNHSYLQQQINVLAQNFADEPSIHYLYIVPYIVQLRHLSYILF